MPLPFAPLCHLPLPHLNCRRHLRAWPAIALGWIAAVAAAEPEAPPAPDSAEATPAAAVATPAETPVETPSVAEDETAEQAATLPERIEPVVAALLPRVGDYHRAALHVDPVEAAVARGDWKPPNTGDEVLDASGEEVAWRPADSPRSSDLAGGYAYATFAAPSAGVMLLKAPGCAAVCLNGEWLPGDPYSIGWFRLPVEVAKGENWLLAHLASPAATPRLVRPAEPVRLITEAARLPDLVAGRPESVALSLPLLNATATPLARCQLRVGWGDDEPTMTPLRRIESLLLTPLTIKLPAPQRELAVGESVAVRVAVLSNEPGAAPLAEATLTLRVVGPQDPRSDTFVSDLDGSVQAYGVLPASGAAENAGVVVSLHDAGETHAQRLAKHTPLASAHVVAPGGRGAWAFDWEDWSRTDALEALDDFTRRQAERGDPIATRRVTVMGTGMGGHGALRLATLRPDRFAAVGVTDGWLSFYTQGGARVVPTDASPMARLLGRAPAAGDPLQVLENLQGVGVSLLSTGNADVSPSEVRFLRERLGAFHNDFAYREAEAAETPRLLHEQADWLTHRELRDNDASDEIDFATPDPAAASTLGWVTVVAAERQGAVARVRLSRDREQGEIVGVTDNVRRLRLSLASFGDSANVSVRLDGGRPVKFRPGRDGQTLSLARADDGVWRRTPNSAPLAALFKEPERSGGLKSAFCCRPQLVYGTRGSKAERSWMAAKARYDAHLFLYRGAGRLEVIADADLRDSLRTLSDMDRSVVLYGSAPANSAWLLLQQEASFRRKRTVRVERGRAWIGARPESDDDLAVLAVRPRPGSAEASIAVVGGTGVVGMRMTTRLRYFWSGVEYPDVLIYGPRAIDSPGDPSEAPDVRAAGYFDADWGLEDGGVVWRDLAI
ncbi:hypothetical protein Pla108_16650 [Botrimarina colliarenosi]|uniref:Alpha/beta hydrolase family protein n=1 Tax=Botrimarina colliarenosi TaxID=2528001 RepID=A0A5C6AL19_9BACT|nr:alpha/beta hydrolase-fold protein [Botrimarina colliarenosi]TWU00713.1 hypothetical protein Pla108_16650 [Botrimarina colliarenosi]